MTDAPALPPEVADVARECADLVAAFVTSGYRLYLVGGIVRDLVGEREPQRSPADDQPDFDFTTDARPAEVKAIVGPVADSVWNQGERFGTIAAHIGGRLLEITTHRAEAYDPDSRKPAVVFSDDVLSDLSRRDFTINAMAIELTAASPRLLDPFDGVTHLAQGVLRTPLSPSESFSDDPLRMLRAARFVARLGLHPDDDVVEAMSTMGDRLAVVSAERIRDEVDKLLLTADPAPGLDLLVDTGLADRFLPELSAGDRSEARRRIGQCVAVGQSLVGRWSVVLLDSGPATARQRLRALRQPSHVASDVATVVGVVSAGRAQGTPWTPPDVRRIVAMAGEHLAVVVDVWSAVGDAGPFTAAVAELEAVEDLSSFEPALDGREVMEHLGLPPGRDVGRALAMLSAVRLAEGVLGRDDALERLEAWWAGARSD